MNKNTIRYIKDYIYIISMSKRIARIIPQTLWDHNIPVGDSTTEVWVFGILKRQLKELDVTIIRTKNYQGDWGFLMTVADGEKVKEVY